MKKNKKRILTLVFALVMTMAFTANTLASTNLSGIIYAEAEERSCGPNGASCSWGSSWTNWDIWVCAQPVGPLQTLCSGGYTASESFKMCTRCGSVEQTGSTMDRYAHHPAC